MSRRPDSLPRIDAASPPEAPLIAIVGPTASGKTAAALAVAERWPVEVISVDSALVYRGLDIGTAKPSPAERVAVPHHLIDVIEPTQAYSAAQFMHDARRLVHEIQARGRLPLLVGGTMLYLKALREGLDTLPPADAATRAAIDSEAAVQGWPALHAALARVDPVTAARLAPHDSQRIQRALEVHRLTGQPLSHWHAAAGENAGWPVHVIALEPTDRALLHARIADRFERMLHSGLLDEVRALRARGDLHADLPSMRCVGYRQAWQALDDGTPDALAAWPARAIAATRQLAKRQLTWLRSLPERSVVDCGAADARTRVVDRVAVALEAGHALA